MYLLNQAAVSSFSPSPIESSENLPVLHLYQHGRFAITKLFQLPPSEIARCDIAERNLICAYGLTGKHDIVMEPMLKLLDVWARRIESQTNQNMKKYLSGQTVYPTLALFKVDTMIRVLTRQIGVRYNPAQIGEPDANPPPMDDPEDAFPWPAWSAPDGYMRIASGSSGRARAKAGLSAQARDHVISLLFSVGCAR